MDPLFEVTDSGYSRDRMTSKSWWWQLHLRGGQQGQQITVDQICTFLGLYLTLDATQRESQGGTRILN